MKPRILTSSVSEARFSSVLNIATDGIIVLDERAQILVFNRACESLFGYASAEVLGAPAEMILPPGKPDDSDGYLWNPGHGRASNVACMSHEAKALHKDGTIFPVELSMGQTMTPEGRQFIGILRDLRSRSAAEQRVNQLQTDVLRTARGSAIDEMGALLAHELNQPLTALLLYLHTVERLSLQPSVNAALPQSAIAILEKAVHEAERAGHIIQRMRRFVEKRDPLRRLTDVTLLIDDAVELALLGARPECRIVCELAPNLPPVAIDPVQIQQIVVNLARNALDAVKDQLTPEVRIGTQQTGGTVMLTVQDNGPGIPAQTVPHLFQPFSSSKRRGLGLGLVISKAIAQDHGGDLTVEPGGNGKGAIFILHLPMPSAVAAPPLVAC